LVPGSQWKIYCYFIVHQGTDDFVFKSGDAARVACSAIIK
jgi:hypothetical protein